MSRINPAIVTAKFAYMKQYLQDLIRIRDISLEEIAAKMYMNNAYLSRIFKEKTCRGFHDFLVEIRISNAKTLLERSEFKVNEIADMSGYRDVSHFIGIFKKHTGMTPIDYRRHVQEVKKTI